MSKITGFIRPPPGVREVVEKTAAFVARGGADFEAKIKSSDSSGKFAFLNPDHPYNAYYKHKIAEIQQGGGATATAASAAGISASSSTATEVAPSSVANTSGGSNNAQEKPPQAKASPIPPRLEIPHPISKAIKFLQAQAKAISSVQSDSQAGRLANGNSERPADRSLSDETPLDSIQSIIQALPPPSQDHFSPSHPSYLTPAELEVIKLTAQFTAAQGKTFLVALQAREGELIRTVQQQQRQQAAGKEHGVASAGGPSLFPTDFDFLKPSHPAFSYFTSLVDQYHLILHPSAYNIAKLRADGGLVIAGTEGPSSTGRAGAAAAGLGTAVGAKSAILARCVHRMEAKRIAEEKRREKEAAASGGGSGGGFVDWHDFVVVGTISFDDDDGDGKDEGKANGNSYAAPREAKEELGIRDVGSSGGSSNNNHVPSFIADAAEKITVRTDYRPAAAVSSATSGLGGVGAQQQHQQVVIDPRTGMVIPLEQAGEHVRIGLLDPKWKQQRDLALSRRSDTLYAPGDQVAENLRNLAQRRGDVFASERGSDALGPPLAKRARMEASAVDASQQHHADEDAPPGT